MWKFHSGKYGFSRETTISGGELVFFETLAEEDHIYEEHMYNKSVGKDNWEQSLDDELNPDIFAEDIRTTEDLLDIRATCSTLIYLIVPYSIQVAALIALNTMLMLTNMSVMENHIKNFLMELRGYLTCLAMNQGTFKRDNTGAKGDSVEESHKRELCRDLGLSIQLSSFKGEISKDAQTVNGGLLLSFVLLSCHFVPLRDQGKFSHRNVAPDLSRKSSLLSRGKKC